MPALRKLLVMSLGEKKSCLISRKHPVYGTVECRYQPYSPDTTAPAASGLCVAWPLAHTKKENKTIKIS